MVSKTDSDRATEDAVDPTELVGPGGNPLRIQPAAALMPGRSDSFRLMTVWFVRKSFYWLFFVGYGIGTWMAYVNHVDNEIDVDWTSPDSVKEGLLSPWSALIVALIVRFAASWIALALAMPLALAHEPNLSPRDNVGSGIGKFFDRLHVARAFRSLRWTHHVRQVALMRLGPTGRRLGRLDPILDIVNIASGLIAFGIALYVASVTAA
jgi:hypothetical protein